MFMDERSYVTCVLKMVLVMAMIHEDYGGTLQRDHASP
jgi:hypothetical protein